MSIGQRLLEFRTLNNLTMAELGESIGVGRSAINSIEKERSMPSVKILLKLVEIHDLCPTWLLIGKGDIFISNNDSVVEEQRIQIKNMNKDIRKLANLNEKLMRLVK